MVCRLIPSKMGDPEHWVRRLCGGGVQRVEAVLYGKLRPPCRAAVSIRGMVTAWSRSGLLRARTSAGPLGLLWLAALLLSILFTHGVSPGGAEGHLTAVVTTPAYASAGSHQGHTSGAAHSDDVAYPSLQSMVAEDRHDGDGSSHSAQQCVSGQPQQGPDMAAPCLAALYWAPATDAYAVGKSGPSRPESTVPSSTGLRVPVVQQV